MIEIRCTECEALLELLDYCYDCLSNKRLTVNLYEIENKKFNKRSHCTNGHAFTEENTRLDMTKKGNNVYQVCKQCHAEKCKRRRERLKSEKTKSTITME